MLDYNELDLNNKTFIGKVLEIDIDNRTCYVYIPKLMIGLPGNKIIKNKYPVNSTTAKIITQDKINILDTITKTNIIKTIARDKDEPMPAIGSNVEIEFFNGNINNAYWGKFNPDGNYDIIEEEKYKKIFTIKINGIDLDIKNDDIIEFNIPEIYSVNVVQSDHKKKIIIGDSININDKIGNIESYIYNLQSNMTDLIKEKIDSYINNINSKIIDFSNNHKSHLLFNETNSTLTSYINKLNNIDNSLSSINKLNNIILNILSNYDSIYTKTTIYKKLLLDKPSIIPILKSNNLMFDDASVDNKTKELFNNYLQNPELCEDLNILNENLSTTKEYNFIYQNTQVKTAIGEIASEIVLPTEDELKEAYSKEKSVDDEEKANLQLIPISYHENKELSLMNEIKLNYFLKSQDVYINIGRIDFTLTLLYLKETPESKSGKYIGLLNNLYEAKSSKSIDSLLDLDKFDFNITLDGSQVYAHKIEDNSWIIDTSKVPVDIVDYNSIKNDLKIKFNSDNIISSVFNVSYNYDNYSYSQVFNNTNIEIEDASL